ncbi:uncharacterized protein B0I36DRAFT_362437 [Microdochium trichocladiopsis]|uniref:Protein kinase domain-containing protein n=1 Tax=Microdochium trichocladiopsis TaxID=1682393 RepID=A0A9P9BTM0_9PEZI|nr:uncharacterized protein B0I36DRAFT_362437 [Microdochium trichocladiopsis]KAH7030604.1 hypothetical protein B0I36DRAFT_362437 [Microdochium trichocladiopsis]
MSGVVEAIPLIVLGIEMLIKLIRKAVQTAEKRKEVKELASYFYQFALSSDKDVLKKIERRATLILRDPTVSSDDNKKLHKIMTTIRSTIVTIEADLDAYVAVADKVFSREKKRLLKNVDSNARRLHADFNRFTSLVDSQEVLRRTPEHLLETYDFDVDPRTPRIWITKSTCIAVGRLSRPTNGVEAGRGLFLLGVRPYSGNLQQRDAQTATAVLNRHLASAEPIPGIRRIIGFRNEENPHVGLSGEFLLVMKIPEIGRRSSWSTLRKCMPRIRKVPSLNEKIGLCAKLANAVLQVHRLGLVHKSIRPEAVLLVENSIAGQKGGGGAQEQRQQQQQQQQQAEGLDRANLYLVDWKHARQSTLHQTRLFGDSAWTANIYQHPQRQGELAESEYCMGHDIYSLGVCMLEILSWNSLVVRQHDDNDDKNLENDEDALICKDFRDAFVALGLDKRGAPPDTFKSEAEWLTKSPASVKSTLLHIVEVIVPIRAGRRMAATIKKCLDCLDDGDERSQHDDNVRRFQERTEKEVGADFVEDILAEIRAVECAL